MTVCIHKGSHLVSDTSFVEDTVQVRNAEPPPPGVSGAGRFDA